MVMGFSFLKKEKLQCKRKNRMVKKIINNKKGWIRLVEVFIGIVLLAGVILVVMNKINATYDEGKHVEIYKKEVAILRDIELNDTLRTAILSATPPVEWDNFGVGLYELQMRIIELSPSNLKCEAKICLLTDECILRIDSEGNVYAQSIIISSDLDTYSPRQLKLFCAEEN